jgi:hypothetical protein
VNPRRPWWRSRRLVAAVLVVDLLGAGLLVYALTRRSGDQHTRTNAAVVQTVARSAQTVPQPATTTASSTTAVHRAHHHRHPRLAPATVMTNPDQSRAPKLSARDKAESSGASLDPTAHGDGALAPNATASFRRLRARLAGQARIAVAVQPLGNGRMQVFGGNPLMPAMSTSKIFILSALLADKGGVRHLTAEQKSLARTAITESDNDSILALFSDLEADQGGLQGASEYATELIRKAGDTTTTVSTGPVPAGYATTFGQTPWSPAQEVTFFRALANGCLLPHTDVRYVLGLMRQIIPSERWGLGSAGFGHVAFKGGWGPLTGGYGVRQTGIVGTGRKRVVVSIAADPATSFATGQQVLGQIAEWVRSELRPVARPATGCSAD